MMNKLAVLSGLIFAWYGCNELVRFCMHKTWFVRLWAFFYDLSKTCSTGNVCHKGIFFFMLLQCLIALAVITGALLRKLLPGIYSFVTGGRGLGNQKK